MVAHLYAEGSGEVIQRRVSGEYHTSDFGGPYVSKNPQAAGEWFLRSADTGDAESWQHYYWLHKKGLYAPLTKKEAKILDLYEKATDAYNAHRYSASFSTFAQAKELGSTWAALAAGSHCEQGLGTPKDNQAALHWYAWCRDQGNRTCDGNYQRLAAEIYAEWARTHCPRTFEDSGCRAAPGLTTSGTFVALQLCFSKNFPRCPMPKY